MHPALRGLTGWELVPLVVGGERVATTAIQGTEVHFALDPGCRPRSSWRGAVRAHFAPLLARRGYLTTRVARERVAQQRFVQRVGFRATWSDGEVTYYLLATLPFERTS